MHPIERQHEAQNARLSDHTQSDWPRTTDFANLRGKHMFLVVGREFLCPFLTKEGETMATVVCTRWLDAFPASYVTVLRNAVAANLNRPHRFVCVTDNVAGLTDGVEGIQMPDLGIPLDHQEKGCWPKLSILAPGVLPADEPTLYLDLDVMINQNLDGFFDRLEAKRGFHALREWNPTLWSLVPLAMRPDRGVQGSILGFYPGEQAELFRRFNEHQQECFDRFDLDQDFLTENAKDVSYWPFAWTSSFKWHCLKYYPLNQIFPKVKRPSKAKVVVFHGDPRPIDVVPQGDYRWGTQRKFGHGPVDWVRDYWLRHDSSWTEEGTELEACVPAMMAA